MTVIYTQKSAAVAQACDGAFGFYDGTSDYIVNGWLNGTTTIKKFWKSTDGGASFSAETDFTYPAHTMATCVVDNVAYIVGGDVFSPTNSGDFIRSSHKFESGAWSQIAADAGIADRCFCQLVYLDGAFYLFGGQDSTTKATATIYDTVMRSDDGCASFTTILADTKTQGFRGGLSWGAFVAYRGLLWKIGGAIYDGSVVNREHETSIFSSPDGITWTYRGEFRGLGRHYHQLVVYNDKIWLIGGGNGMYGPNLEDIWTIELRNNGRLVQTYLGAADFGERHAHTAWVSADGILVFGGSSNSSVESDCWLISES